VSKRTANHQNLLVSNQHGAPGYSRQYNRLAIAWVPVAAKTTVSEYTAFIGGVVVVMNTLGSRSARFYTARKQIGPMAGMATARPITNLVWQCHTNKLINNLL